MLILNQITPNEQNKKSANFNQSQLKYFYLVIHKFISNFITNI
jgi:hypothetical protein